MANKTVNKIADLINSSMAKMVKHAKINKIVVNYKKEQQEDVAIEEMSELTKAILKARRKNSSDKTELIDEIADVKIMIEQLEIINDCRDEVEKRIEYKLDRQLERIKKENEEDADNEI